MAGIGGNNRAVVAEAAGRQQVLEPLRGGPLRGLRRDLDAHGFGASISAPRTQGPTR